MPVSVLLSVGGLHKLPLYLLFRSALIALCFFPLPLPRSRLRLRWLLVSRLGTCYGLSGRRALFELLVSPHFWPVWDWSMILLALVFSALMVFAAAYVFALAGVDAVDGFYVLLSLEHADGGYVGVGGEGATQ